MPCGREPHVHGVDVLGYRGFLPGEYGRAPGVRRCTFPADARMTSSGRNSISLPDPRSPLRMALTRKSTAAWLIPSVDWRIVVSEG